MNEKKYISRNEAAETCGVTPQTISNWCMSGLVRYTDRYAKKRKVRLYLKEDLEKMKPVAEEIEMKTIEIEDYMKALEKEKQDVIAGIEEARRERVYQAENAWVFKEIVRICLTILESYYGNANLAVNTLTSRELAVLEGMLKMKHVWAISEELWLSPERVRQIREKALRKVTSPENVVDINGIIAENNSLKNDIAKAMAKLSLAEQKLTDYGLNHVEVIEDEEMRKKLSTKISDRGVSVRLYNCLKVMDIRTFADVVSWPRREILKFRNFGKKSMMELELLLEEMGLGFSMEVEKYGFENHYKAYYRGFWR